MANLEKIKKLSDIIDRAMRERDAELNGDGLHLDLALETNVRSISGLYESRAFTDLENTCSLIIQQCRTKWMDQRSPEDALRAHGKLPPGLKIPNLWNAPDNSFFRAGAPVVISSASGVGKSTTARNIIVHNILNKIPTVYVTNEDTKAEAVIGLFTIYAKLHLGLSLSFMEVERWNHESLKPGASDKAKESARQLYIFAKQIQKYVCIIEAEYWSMSRIIFGAENAENYFGRPADCVILDYAQRIDPEPASKNKDIRLQMIEASRMWANYVKSKQKVGILISQLNDDGKTAESRQFEKDAGQWVVIERKYDDSTDTFSEEVVIRFKKGRRTGTGRVVCHIDGSSGAFIPSALWRPAESRLDFRSGNG